MLFFLETLFVEVSFFSTLVHNPYVDGPNTED